MSELKVGDKIKVKGRRGSWPAGTWTCVAKAHGRAPEFKFREWRSYSEVDAMLDAAAKPRTSMAKATSGKTKRERNGRTRRRNSGETLPSGSTIAKRVPVWLVWYEHVGTTPEYPPQPWAAVATSYAEAQEIAREEAVKIRHVEITGPHYQKISA